MAASDPSPWRAGLELKEEEFQPNGARMWDIKNRQQETLLLAGMSGPAFAHKAYILNVEHCVVKIPAKINTVCLENLANVDIECAGFVSSMEFLRCNNVTVSCTGPIPTLQLDESHTCRVYLQGGAEIPTVFPTNSEGYAILVGGQEVQIPSNKMMELVDGDWKAQCDGAGGPLTKGAK
mmetsp:Transcript_50485/g.118468  ORF Transcript_50485/g.118468 Transcript_50485/m.118468 type:complete len:179 (-) Transcript_50485:24-560(-)